MSRARYYQLIASLPRLPRFEQADRLPISPQRLEERLALLEPTDAADLALAQAMVSWHVHPTDRSEADAIALSDQVLHDLKNRELRDFVAFRLELRTVMAALRRRRRGEGPPSTRWGVSPRTDWIERHWSDPHFGLATVIPWIPAARDLLLSGHAAALEKLLMEQTWVRLARIAERHPFGFEDVFSYVFRWDIVQRWLTYDATVATRRFASLVAETIDGHIPTFG